MQHRGLRRAGGEHTWPASCPSHVDLQETSPPYPINLSTLNQEPGLISLELNTTVTLPICVSVLWRVDSGDLSDTKKDSFCGFLVGGGANPLVSLPWCQALYSILTCNHRTECLLLLYFLPDDSTT